MKIIRLALETSTETEMDTIDIVCDHIVAIEDFCGKTKVYTTGGLVFFVLEKVRDIRCEMGATK